MSAFMETKGLCRYFGGVQAIHELDLTVREGLIQAIIGPNGAGKSTLAECIFGYYQNEEGEILIHGKPARLSTPSEARFAATFPAPPSIFSVRCAVYTSLSGSSGDGRL